MINVDDDSNAFLGTGWSFPIGLTSDGRISTESAGEDIHQSIRIILDTNPGERLMRPDFGAGLNTFVFEPVNTATIARVKKRVKEALTAWEPRIEVIEVQVTSQPESPEKLLIDVQYKVWATNSRHNLVYPFYLDEGVSK
jgi:uncharacterized protein